MTYQNLQLQTVTITFESSLSSTAQTEFAIATRFSPLGQFSKISSGEMIVNEVLNLGQQDQLRIFVRGIRFGDAVTIKDIEVGNITLQHYIYQGRQYQPLAKQCYCPGTEFQIDGVFELDITLPIWRWIMNHIEREIRESQVS